MYDSRGEEKGYSRHIFLSLLALVINNEKQDILGRFFIAISSSYKQYTKKNIVDVFLPQIREAYSGSVKL